ncbi:MAG TPA: hypothetical protein VJ385_02135 [Fibrobacteria bacterium]|nr:hypothetical protein [Fibrobacteria bacterium]
MNPQESKAVRTAARQIESALKVFEDYLEDSNSEALYKSCGNLIQVLRHLHGMDPTLVAEENRARIEALLLKEKPKSGRDTFTTGF